MWAKSFFTSTFANQEQDESFQSSHSDISGIINLDDQTTTGDDWANDLTDALLDSTIMAPPQVQQQPQAAGADAGLDRTFVDPNAQDGVALVIENANCDNEQNVAWVEFSALRASWIANKGWITRWTGYLDVHLGAMGNNTATQLDIDKGEDYSRKLQAKSEEMILQLQRMAFLCPQVTNDCDAKAKAIYDANIASYRNFQQVCAQYRAHMRAQPQPAAPANQGNRSKVDESLRPDKLTIEHTPADMDMWIREFRTYYDSGQMNLKSINEQRGYLSRCLDDNLKKVLLRQVLPDTMIWGQNGCIETLKHEFTRIYPIFARRKAFFTMQPERGENFRDFRMRLRDVADTADLEKLTVNDLFLYKYHTTVNDEALKQALITMAGKPLALIDAYIDAFYESERGQMLTRSERVYRTQEGGRGKGGNQPTGKKTQECTGCGLKSHMKEKCFFKNEKCKACHLVGHKEGHPICKKKGKRKTRRIAEGEDAQEESADDDSSGSSCRIVRDRPSTPHPGKRVLVYRAPPKDMPEVCAEIINDDGELQHGTSILDTGADASVISSNLLEQWGWEVSTTKCKPMYSVTGHKMDMAGQINVAIRVRSTVEPVELTFNVCRDTHDEIIVGFTDLKKVKVLPKNWPHSEKEMSDFVDEKEAIVRVMKSDTQLLTAALIKEYADVIKDEIDEKPCTTKETEIKFRDDIEIKPRKTSIARRIPVHFEDPAGKLIDNLVKNGIIKKVEGHTDWISPAFFVPKSNNVDVRLVTDYKYINQFIKRPVHPFPSAKEIAERVKPTSKYFACLDAVKGYYQLPLSEESSFKTCFIIPSGKYRYLRNPMGLNISGDEWNEYSDKAVEGIEGVDKIVDDILIQGATEQEVMEKTRQVLDRCRELGITISRKKLTVGQEVDFAGFAISANGIMPDLKHIKAIRDFPTPKNVKDVRSFLGLANQLANFIPDLAQNCCNIKKLLEKRNAFLWTEIQEREFQQCKQLLTSNPILKPYDINLPTTILTDASKLYGLGFALIQEDEKGEKRLIKCGSTGLNDTQKRYAVIELEALALQYGLDKCDYFVRGCPEVKVMTDHKPLKGIWEHELADVTNPRLLRLRLKTLQYNLKIEWTEGKTHYIADALSRYPVFEPEAGCPELDNAHVYICRRLSSRTPWSALMEASKNDEDYQCILECLKMDDFTCEKNDLPPEHPTKMYTKQWHRMSTLLSGNEDAELIVIDGEKFLVPEKARKFILSEIHKGHPGINKMTAKAHETYFWNGMTNDIKNFVANCKECQKLHASKQKSELQQEIASAPMSNLGIDLFTFKGKQFFVAICRFSGYLFVREMKKLNTDFLIDQLTQIFRTFGYPMAIRTDNGPQFRAPFSKFCEERGIKHETASCYHPEGNGLSEAGVKQAKMLMKKIGAYNEEYKEHLCAYLHTPRVDGDSPSKLMFGRKLRQEGEPVAEKNLRPALNNEGRIAERGRVNAHKNKTRAPVTCLDPGQRVLVQCPKTKEWNKEAKVLEIRDSEKSLIVIDLETNVIQTRSIDHIRPDPRFKLCANPACSFDCSSTQWASSTLTTPPTANKRATTPEAASSTYNSRERSLSSSGSESSPSSPASSSTQGGDTTRPRTSNCVPSTGTSQKPILKQGPVTRSQATATRSTNISYAEIVAGTKRTQSGEECRRLTAAKRVTFNQTALSMGNKTTATWTRSKGKDQPAATPTQASLTAPSRSARCATPSRASRGRESSPALATGKISCQPMSTCMRSLTGLAGSQNNRDERGSSKKIGRTPPSPLHPKNPGLHHLQGKICGSSSLRRPISLSSMMACMPKRDSSSRKVS